MLGKIMKMYYTGPKIKSASSGEGDKFSSQHWPASSSMPSQEVLEISFCSSIIQFLVAVTIRL